MRRGQETRKEESQERMGEWKSAQSSMGLREKRTVQDIRGQERTGQVRRGQDIGQVGKVREENRTGWRGVERREEIRQNQTR